MHTVQSENTLLRAQGQLNLYFIQPKYIFRGLIEYIKWLLVIRVAMTVGKVSNQTWYYQAGNQRQQETTSTSFTIEQLDIFRRFVNQPSP